MNIQVRERPEAASSVTAKTAIADCDIHPARATRTELYPFLAKRWHDRGDRHPPRDHEPPGHWPDRRCFEPHERSATQRGRDRIFLRRNRIRDRHILGDDRQSVRAGATRRAGPGPPGNT